MNEKVFEYVIWDKTSPIGNASAESFLGRNPRFVEDTVIIVSVGGVAGYVESVPSLRSRFQLPASTPDQEVIDMFMYNLENNLEQEPRQVQKWKKAENEHIEAKKELFQAKLTLMKEGLI